MKLTLECGKTSSRWAWQVFARSLASFCLARLFSKHPPNLFHHQDAMDVHALERARILAGTNQSVTVEDNRMPVNVLTSDVYSNNM